MAGNTKPKYSVKGGPSKASSLMLTKATKTLGTSSATKFTHVTKKFKQTSAKKTVGKKGKKREKRRKVPSQVQVPNELKPAINHEKEVATATTPDSTVSPPGTSTDQKIEKEDSPPKVNQIQSDPPEEITLAMSPDLFQKNGYARTDYKSDGESDKEEDPKLGSNNDEENDSDKSVSMSQLSPGERALIASTFGISGWSGKPGNEVSSNLSKNTPAEDENSSDSVESNNRG